MRSREALRPLLAALALLGAEPAPQSPSAREIMQRVEDRDDGDLQTSDLEMVLIDKNQSERVRRIRSFSRDVGPDTQSIMFFLTPADVKDTGFLTYDYDDAERDDDQWLYLPALHKSKRIASNDKSGSFMGSDFNYSDMTDRELERYDYELMKQTEVEGHAVWQIKSVPRSNEEIDRSGYKQSVLFVRQDNYVVIRSVHWLDKGSKLRYFDVTKLEQIDGIWVSTEMTMTTRKGDQTLHRTLLRISNVKFNQPLADSLFSVRQLEKGL